MNKPASFSLERVCTQAEFGDLVGISQPAVAKLLEAGILVQGDTADVWLKTYCARLREVAGGRSDTLTDARARLANEQANKIAMQNARARRELAPVTLIEEVLSRVATQVVGILDAIPGAVKRRCPVLTNADVDMISAEIAKARNTAAAIELNLDDLDDFDVEQAEGREGGTEGSEGLLGP